MNKIKDTRTSRLRDWQAYLARKKGFKLASAWIKKRFPDGQLDKDTLLASINTVVPDKVAANAPETWKEAKKQAIKHYPDFEFDRWSFGCGWQDALEVASKNMIKLKSGKILK